MVDALAFGQRANDSDDLACSSNASSTQHRCDVQTTPARRQDAGDEDVFRRDEISATTRHSSAATRVLTEKLHGGDIGADNARWANRSTFWNSAVTPFDSIVRHPYEGKGTEEAPFLVSWIGDDDAENPLNYSSRAKWTLTAFVSFATLCVSLASSAYAGAAPSIRSTLGGSTVTITLGISLYVLGFALGPLGWAPVSEVVGRRNSFLVSFSLFAACNAAACASPNLTSLLILRFFAGAFGSSPLTNAGGSIADVFKAKERGLAMALFASFPLAGPALGPIAGGFLGEAKGFRWVMGLIAIYASVVTVAGYFFHGETYAPLLLRRRAAKLSLATGKCYMSKLDVGKNVSFVSEVKVALTRPWLLLVREPIVLLLSLYSALVYSILYSFLASFPIVFGEVRGWSAGVVGLAFLGILVGMLAGIALQVFQVNPAYKRQVDLHGGITAPPEARLPQAMWAAVLLVVGLAGFAATDAVSIHWIVPIGFSVPFGAAMVMSFIAIQSYLIDSYLIYAASVLAANSVVRSLLGAAFPLFTPYMYHPGGGAICPVATCGIHVGPAIAAFLSLVFLPAPFYFYQNGARIRQQCKYSAEANEILEAMLRTPGSEDGHSSRGSTAGDVEKDAAAACNAHAIVVAPVYLPAVDEQEDEMNSIGDFRLPQSTIQKTSARHAAAASATAAALERAQTLQRYASRRSQAQETLERVPSYVI